nr:MoaF C-terminal domain-containing protein [Brucella inopinata]
MVPEETRDLIGLRAHFTYSPNHVYEHTYLSSKRYAWQCLVGVQRGHGDVDLATTYKFAEGQYVFTFREFKIPVASTFFYNFADMRSTGKFLGINGQGAIQNSPAGAFIRKASVTFYHPGQEPV